MSDPLLPAVDHLLAALARLAEQYRNKPNFAGLFAVLARQVQDIETTIGQLYNGRTLADAIGAQLGMLERVVGQRQFVFTDDTVRKAWIGARILLNHSSGTGNDLLNIFKAVLPAPLVPELTERFPAALEMHIAGGALPSDLVDPLGRMLQLGKAAGVGAQMLYGLSSPAEVMRFARPVAFMAFTIPDDQTGFFVSDVDDPNGEFSATDEFDILIGGQTSVGETQHVLSYGGGVMSLDGATAFSHEAGEEILLVGHNYGSGFGDASSPGGGGKMGGAV